MGSDPQGDSAPDSVHGRTRRALAYLLMLGLFGISLAAGYWASRSLAPAELREEVEATLGAILGDVRVGAVGIGWRRGLRLEARAIELREAGAVPFSIGRAELGIGIESLWEGRPIVEHLAFYGLTAEITRDPTGSWQPEVLNRWIQDEVGSEGAAPRGGIQDWAVRLARRAEGAHLDQIELRESAIRITWETETGSASAALGSVDLVLAPEDGGEALHALGKAFPAQAGPGGQLELAARFAGAASRARLELYDIDLAEFSPWLALWSGPVRRVSGRANGSVGWAPGAEVTRVDAELRVATVELDRAEASPLPIGDVQLRAVALLSAKGVRLTDLDVGLGEDELALSGHLEAHLPKGSRDGQLEGVLRLAPCSIATVRDVGGRVGFDNLIAELDRARAGTIRRAKLTLAATRLQQIEAWLERPAVAWPAGLRLEVEANGFEIDLDADEALRDLSGTARIDRNKLALAASGQLGDRPLPSIDLTLQGWRELAAMPESPATPAPVPALRGRIPLTEWIIEQIDPDDPPFARQLDLSVDWLDHPALFWRLDRTVATLRPVQPGIDVVLHEGLWGGVPVSGTGRLSGERPSQRIELEIRVHPRADANARVGAERGFRPRDGVHWASASFDAAVTRVGKFPARRVTGDLVIAGTSLLASGVEIEMMPRGKTLGFVSLDLSRPDAVPTSFGFQMDDASLPAVISGVGGDGENWDGVLVLAGQLDAQLAPGQPLLESLEGPISGHARNGEFRHRVPWALAIAAASETFNPFGSRETLPYDAIDAELRLARGRLDIQSFALKGPTLRLVATGSVETLGPGVPIEVVMGVFLFRGVDVALGKIPILGSLFLGSDESLVPAYFSLTGPYADPRARLVPIKTLVGGPAGIVVEGVPNFVMSGLQRLGQLFALQPEKEDDGSPPQLGEAP